MYKNLTLYYLKQLGITPWVDRNASFRKILILIPATLNPSVKALLDQMLLYLALEKKDIYLLDWNKSSDINEINTKIKKINPIFGLIFEQSFAVTDLLIESTTLLNPIELLKNPLKKKEVFNQLTAIKTKIHEIIDQRNNAA